MFRIEKLTRLVNVIDELEEEKITFSTATKRTKRDHWKRESKAFMSLLGKIVGSDRQDKASYLLYHLRSLYPFRSHISVCVDDFDVMRDYSAISQNSRSKLGKTRSTHAVFKIPTPPELLKILYSGARIAS